MCAGKWKSVQAVLTRIGPGIVQYWILKAHVNPMLAALDSYSAEKEKMASFLDSHSSTQHMYLEMHMPISM